MIREDAMASHSRMLGDSAERWIIHQQWVIVFNQSEFPLLIVPKYS